MKPKIYIDNSVAPIIAIDFDHTISINADKYPIPGDVRPFAKDVINFLYDIGVKIVIWTSRDENDIIDDIQPAIDWLKGHNIQYSAINNSDEFAPYAYNSRKIYAHLYVDDRAFGWNENKQIMINVLRTILLQCIIDATDTKYDIHYKDMVDVVTYKLIIGGNIDNETYEYFREIIRDWKSK